MTTGGWNFGDAGITDPVVISRAVKALNRYSVASALEEIGQKSMLFISVNAERLKSQTMFEVALCFAHIRFHNATFPLERLVELFKMADPEQLRAVAHHRYLPENENITVYRGVVGDETKRQVQAISWTNSIHLASYIAIRWAYKYGLEDVRVYTVTIPTDAVLLRVGSETKNLYELMILPPIPGEIRRVPRATIEKSLRDIWFQHWLLSLMHRKIDVLGELRKLYTGKK